MGMLLNRVWALAAAACVVVVLSVTPFTTLLRVLRMSVHFP